MTDIARIVACDADFWMDDHALVRAQAATRDGFKQCWQDGVPGGFHLGAQLASDDHAIEACFLLWQGPEEEFILFRLTENTDLVIAHQQVDVTGNEWQQLTQLVTAAHAAEARRGLFDEDMTSAAFAEMENAAVGAQEAVALHFARMIPDIMGRLL